MRRRVLAFLLAGFVVLGSVLGCVPMRAGAIVPLGLVQSALASYVTSTGYKMYNDQGTGQDILDSLSDLYQTWLDSPAGQVLSLWTLTHISSIDAVYADQSGNIVITKQAADVFQQFSDWIASEYNIAIGSDTPTQVVSSSGFSGDGTFSVPSQYFVSSSGFLASIGDRTVTKTYNGAAAFCVYRGTNGYYNPFIASTDSNAMYVNGVNPAGNYYSIMYDNVRVYYYASGGRSGNPNIVSDYPVITFDIQPSTEQILRYIGFDVVNTDTSSGVKALAVTIAQSVADVAGRIEEDDQSLVVGVGAGVGATAEDIAGLVAQGVKAQTLDPDVTVVADAVIDTPVQPYPDIDSLGLPQLGATLVSRFPFCIPWDFVDTVKLLSADPVAPNIAVDLFPAAFKSKVGVTGSTEFRINLGDEKYQIIGTFCRWGSLISFCFGLAILTKRMIWTA